MKNDAQSFRLRSALVGAARVFRLAARSDARHRHVAKKLGLESEKRSADDDVSRVAAKSLRQILAAYEELDRDVHQLFLGEASLADLVLPLLDSGHAKQASNGVPELGDLARVAEWLEQTHGYVLARTDARPETVYLQGKMQARSGPRDPLGIVVDQYAGGWTACPESSFEPEVWQVFDYAGDTSPVQVELQWVDLDDDVSVEVSSDGVLWGNGPLMGKRTRIGTIWFSPVLEPVGGRAKTTMRVVLSARDGSVVTGDYQIWADLGEARSSTSSSAPIVAPKVITTRPPRPTPTSRPANLLSNLDPAQLDLLRDKLLRLLDQPTRGLFDLAAVSGWTALTRGPMSADLVEGLLDG